MVRSSSAVRQYAARTLGDADIQRKAAERELAKAEGALVRTEPDYDAGDITGRQYNAREERLTGEIAAARAQVEQYERRRGEVEAALAILDAERAVAEELTALRRAVIGEVSEAKGLDALRVVLRRLFAGFVLRTPESQSWFLATLDGEPWQGEANVKLGDGSRLFPWLRSDHALIPESPEWPGGHRVALTLRLTDTKPTAHVTPA